MSMSECVFMRTEFNASNTHSASPYTQKKDDLHVRKFKIQKY